MFIGLIAWGSFGGVRRLWMYIGFRCLESWVSDFRDVRDRGSTGGRNQALANPN